MNERILHCAMCDQDFVGNLTDEEANAEAEAVWKVRNASTDPDMVCVCDDCYQEMIRLLPPEQFLREVGNDLRARR